ncbi:MAG: hypothetical protein EOO36_04555 [Cytophagaceae bacterium]|nr:MAG: hypothetical protein EOO36_04555 [Cytophagaceae bacterium]
MKLISPTLHGIIDYIVCGIFMTLPSEFGLTGTYAAVCYLLAGGYLVISLLTNMPFGLFKWIPFWLHGRLELVSGFVFIASPWLFGYAGNTTMRNLFMVVGIVFLFVFALTQWQPQGSAAAELQKD